VGTKIVLADLVRVAQYWFQEKENEMKTSAKKTSAKTLRAKAASFRKLAEEYAAKGCCSLAAGFREFATDFEIQAAKLERSN
jgi:hypothetical protein